jgi:hypothetical protein
MPVNDPPLSVLPAEQVRHPQRRLTDLRGVIEPPSAALDIDRVREVLVHAFQLWARSSQPSAYREAAHSRRGSTAAQPCS